MEIFQEAIKLAAFGSVFLALVALCYRVWQNIQHYKWQKKEKSLSYSITKSEKTKTSRTKLAEAFDLQNRINDLPISMEEIVSAYKHKPEIYTCLRDVMGHWENMALAIEKEIADNEVAYEMVASMVVTYTFQFQNFIKSRREHSPRAYEYLEQLVKKWQSKMGDHEPPKHFNIELSPRPKILVITDSTSHSPDDSIYSICRFLSTRSDIYICSRSEEMNETFFSKGSSKKIVCKKYDQDFIYDYVDDWFEKGVPQELTYFDAFLLRLDNPNLKSPLNPTDISNSEEVPFLENLGKNLNKPIFNNPKGILETRRREFILQFHKGTGFMDNLKSLEKVRDRIRHKDTVIKLDNSYGGNGVFKFEGQNRLVEFDSDLSKSVRQAIQDNIDKFGAVIAQNYIDSVKEKGDTRILVAFGKAVGAFKRYPREGEFRSNLAQGGRAEKIIIEPKHETLVSKVNPELKKNGIAIYGLDILEDDDGNQYLIEINVVNVGGFKQAGKTNNVRSEKILADKIVDQTNLLNKLYKTN